MQLPTFLKTNSTAKAVITSFSDRQRNRKDINLTRMEYFLRRDSKTNIIHDDLIKTFKALEDAGCGQLVIGRNGKPDRFQMHCSFDTILESYNKMPVLVPNGQLTAPVDVKTDKKGNRLTKDGRIDRRKFNPGRKAKTATESAPLLTDAPFAIPSRLNADPGTAALMLAIPSNVDPVELSALINLIEEMKQKATKNIAN